MRRQAVGLAVVALILGSAPALAQDPVAVSTSEPTVRRVSFLPLHDAVTRHAKRLASTSVPVSARQAAPPHRNWFARHPVVTGTMVGAGIGLVWISAEGCSSSDYTCSGLVLFSVGTGAGLGALGGLVAAIVMK